MRYGGGKLDYLNKFIASSSERGALLPDDLRKVPVAEDLLDVVDADLDLQVVDELGRTDEFVDDLDAPQVGLFVLGVDVDVRHFLDDFGFSYSGYSAGGLTLTDFDYEVDSVLLLELVYREILLHDPLKHLLYLHG